MSPSRSLLLAVLASGLSLPAIGCIAGADANVAPAARPMAPVRVAAATVAPVERRVVAHGVTRSTQRGAAGFVDGGRLVARSVDLGDVVEAGQVLARLDPAPYRHQADAARAQVRQLEAQQFALEADRRRLAALTVGASVSQGELDRIVAQVDAVRASLDAARAAAADAERRAADAVLRAPYAGLVVAVNAQPGETVAPGRPVVELAGAGQLEVEIQVPEGWWAHLAVGQPARVALPAIDRQSTGQVLHVATAARPDGLFPVVVGLDATDLASGLTADVHLGLPLDATALVPLASVVDPVGQGPRVLRIVEGQAEHVPLASAVLLDEGIAITGAVEPGDELVVAGHARVLDGDVVRVIR
jgi:RND family efflux transporter MFP subunit